MISVGKLAVWQHLSPDARARVLLVHGIGEHSGRHLNTIQFLNSHAIEVVRFDLRGAGLSGGPRQYVDSFDDYVEDTHTVASWIRTHFTPLPLFLLGHSLGGTVCILYTAHFGKTLRGLLLSAPAHLPGNIVSEFKKRVGQSVVSLLPYLRISRLNDFTVLSRDPEVGRAYAADPLCCHYSTLKQGDVILRTLPRILDSCESIKVPTLIVHGSADKVMRLEGSYHILRALAAPDKSLMVMPGGYHEPHNDLDKEIYFNEIRRWIEKRIG